MSQKNKPKEQETPELEAIRKCLETITASGSYDDVGGEIYQILLHKAGKPYDQWVQTWLIKCIKECFKSDPVKMDIMFAHFALLPEFTLYMPIKDRLMRYVEISGYLVRYPTDSKRSFDEIKNDPDDKRRKEELKSIENKITRMQRGLVNELAEYIETVSSPEQHISELEEYGELKIIKGEKVYCPFTIELNVPKPRVLEPVDAKCLRNGNIESEISPQQLTDDFVDRSKKDVARDVAISDTEEIEKLDNEAVVAHLKESQAAGDHGETDVNVDGLLEGDVPPSGDPSNNGTFPNIYTGMHTNDPPSEKGGDREEPDTNASFKQWADFTLKVLGIIVGTILASILITAVGGGRVEIPTANGTVTIDFSRRDYFSEKQLGTEIAASFQTPDSIAISPSELDKDNNDAIVPSPLDDAG